MQRVDHPWWCSCTWCSDVRARGSTPGALRYVVDVDTQRVPAARHERRAWSWSIKGPCRWQDPIANGTPVLVVGTSPTRGHNEAVVVLLLDGRLRAMMAHALDSAPHAV